MVSFFIPLLIIGAFIAYKFFFSKQEVEEIIDIDEQGLPVFKDNTQYIYYPEDQIPVDLQPKSAILPYDSTYGCPPGYDVKSQTMGYYAGVPGLPNKTHFCSRRGGGPDTLSFEDPYHIPTYYDPNHGAVYTVGGSNDYASTSNALRDYLTRSAILTNYNYATLSSPFGGLGDLPAPPTSQYPTQIGNIEF